MRNYLKAISVSLIVGILYSLNVFGQIDSLGPSDLKFYDRFGKIHSINDLIIPQEDIIIDHSHQCTAGFFQLTFMDVVLGTGLGFNDMDSILAQARKDLVCQVFTDLAQLIVPSTDPCTGTLPTVEIQIHSNFTFPDPIPPGVLAGASSFYLIIGGNSGFIDGAVWESINSGSDPFVNFQQLLFHGFMVVNFSGVSWHIDPDTIAVSPDFDMYSVILHESFHSLGFASLIDSLGNSKILGSNFYSRYDKFLRLNGGNFFILNQDSCYDVIFNVNSTDLEFGCQNVVFDDGSQFLLTSQPVYAPSPFEPGSSLSHFEIGCGGFPTPDYVMNPSIGQGVNKRVPTPEEVQTLCALGYQTTGTFGDFTLSFHTDTLPACGTIVAGTNDFGPACTNQQFSIQLCAPSETIEICNFLQNDVNAVNYSCLEIQSGGGTIINQTANCFSYITTSPGHKVICYTPIWPWRGRR